MAKTSIRWSKGYHEDLGTPDKAGFYDYAYRYYLYTFNLPDNGRIVARQYTDEADKCSLFLHESDTAPTSASILRNMLPYVAAVVRWLAATESIARFDYFDNGYHQLNTKSLPARREEIAFVQMPANK